MLLMPLDVSVATSRQRLQSRPCAYRVSTARSGLRRARSASTTHSQSGAAAWQQVRGAPRMLTAPLVHNCLYGGFLMHHDPSRACAALQARPQTAPGTGRLAKCFPTLTLPWATQSSWRMLGVRVHVWGTWTITGKQQHPDDGQAGTPAQQPACRLRAPQAARCPRAWQTLSATTCCSTMPSWGLGTRSATGGPG